ncbi:MAG: hypothetical protein AseanaTS_16220 [Candidatus Pelagadaptatus aseana]|uniref:GGDEF domain-containing protein n=1 Tax=Candidatus Pelagadaptatus aseana TaxID=3120508 RepID=UPI0039B17BE9
MKVAVASLFCALIYSTVVCSFLLFSSRTNLHQTLVLIFGSVVLLLLVRCYVAANPENNMTLFDRENLITSLTLLGIFGFLFAAGFGQLLLLKQHDDDRLKEAASKDPLTNVYNRRAFFEHVEHFANMAIRDRSCISFLMIDLDNFKSINDNFGHDHGDKVLIDFSEKVSQLIRREDVFGRFGGEEFCVMMACGKDKAMEVAERIRLAMTSHLVGRPESDYCTVSIGVCSDVPESSGCADRMIVVADGCLYKAKQEGRNRVLCA